MPPFVALLRIGYPVGGELFQPAATILKAPQRGTPSANDGVRPFARQLFEQAVALDNFHENHRRGQHERDVDIAEHALDKMSEGQSLPSRGGQSNTGGGQGKADRQLQPENAGEKDGRHDGQEHEFRHITTPIKIAERARLFESGFQVTAGFADRAGIIDGDAVAGNLAEEVIHIAFGDDDHIIRPRSGNANEAVGEAAAPRFAANVHDDYADAPLLAASVRAWARCSS
jgi:hypothetical protein